MAFGMAFGGNGGKLILSLFRIALSIFIIIYIRRLLKTGNTHGHSGWLVFSPGRSRWKHHRLCFYGLIFSSSGLTQVATLFPADGGYAPFTRQSSGYALFSLDRYRIARGFSSLWRQTLCFLSLHIQCSRLSHNLRRFVPAVFPL